MPVFHISPQSYIHNLDFCQKGKRFFLLRTLFTNPTIKNGLYTSANIPYCLDNTCLLFHKLSMYKTNQFWGFLFIFTFSKKLTVMFDQNLFNSFQSCSQFLQQSSVAVTVQKLSIYFLKKYCVYDYTSEFYDYTTGISFSINWIHYTIIVIRVVSIFFYV